MASWRTQGDYGTAKEIATDRAALDALYAECFGCMRVTCESCAAYESDDYKEESR